MRARMRNIVYVSWSVFRTLSLCSELWMWREEWASVNFYLWKDRRWHTVLVEMPLSKEPIRAIVVLYHLSELGEFWACYARTVQTQTLIFPFGSSFMFSFVSPADGAAMSSPCICNGARHHMLSRPTQTGTAHEKKKTSDLVPELRQMFVEITQ